jgi:hypothetical protein
MVQRWLQLEHERGPQGQQLAERLLIDHRCRGPLTRRDHSPAAARKPLGVNPARPAAAVSAWCSCPS